MQNVVNVRDLYNGEELEFITLLDRVRRVEQRIKELHKQQNSLHESLAALDRIRPAYDRIAELWPKMNSRFDLGQEFPPERMHIVFEPLNAKRTQK